MNKLTSDALTQRDRALADLTYHAEAPEKFFSAWRDAVLECGIAMFGHGEREAFEVANNRNDLKPNFDIIAKHWPHISDTVRLFLLIVLAFYSAPMARAISPTLFARTQSLTTLAAEARLDAHRRDILARLFLYFTGW